LEQFLNENPVPSSEAFRISVIIILLEYFEGRRRPNGFCTPCKGFLRKKLFCIKVLEGSGTAGEEVALKTRNRVRKERQQHSLSVGTLALPYGKEKI
jgi:hypothetical protein